MKSSIQIYLAKHREQIILTIT